VNSSAQTLGLEFPSGRKTLIKYLIGISISILTLDIAYKSIYGITYQNRVDCAFYNTMPRWLFLVYEYFIELMILVLVGIFAATLVERYLAHSKRLIPRNCLSAFVIASVIPVCSCSAIPFIRAMKDHIPFRAVITFVVAAPLLNPYIIILSFTVLGAEYAVLRIVCSFLLAVSTGYVVEFFWKRSGEASMGNLQLCGNRGGCMARGRDVFETTYRVSKDILPFLVVAGALGMAVELFAPGDLVRSLTFENSLLGTAMITLIGIPVYFCNGADVLFLQPLMIHQYLPMGMAIAFSMTSTSVCVTSLVLLMKFLGKRLTLVLLISLVTVTMLMSYLIQMVPWRTPP
jgi:hypothetical protein